jgi:hypothetical protein
VETGTKLASQGTYFLLCACTDPRRTALVQSEIQYHLRQRNYRKTVFHEKIVKKNQYFLLMFFCNKSVFLVGLQIITPASLNRKNIILKEAKLNLSV